MPSHARGGAPWMAVALLLALVVPAALPVPAASQFPWSAGRTDLQLVMRDRTVLDATLWVPPEAGAGALAPGVVAVHGWGDDKLNGYAKREYQRGYVALAYSTRGFGESTGQVDAVGPRSMGDLAEVLDWMRASTPVDPARIAVVGPSHGGAHAALAATRPELGLAAVAALVPWTDLAQALRPNGVPKLSLPLAFYVGGNGLVQDGDQPMPLRTGDLDLDLGPLGRVHLDDVNLGRRQLYDTYDPELHLMLASSFTGLASDTAAALMAERSALRDAERAQAPTLVMTGLTDDLFPLDQGLPFFERLGSAEKMLYLGGGGHPRAVEKGPEVDAMFRLMDRWLDHYLRGIGERPYDPAAPIVVAPQPWSGTTLSLSSWPAGATGTPHALGADGSLGAPSGPGEAVLVNTGAAGLPDDPVFGGLTQDLPGGTDLDTVVFRSAALPSGGLLLGTPRAELALRPLGAVVRLAVKVFDVAPDGSATLVTRGVWGARDILPGAPLEVVFDLQGIAWRFDPGHAVEVRVATSDVPTYGPEREPFAVVLGLGEDASLVRMHLTPALP